MGIAYEIEIAKFQFPQDLDGDKANFRLQVDLRYQTAGGTFDLHTVIMPGLDLFWECDEAKNQKGEHTPDGHLVRLVKDGKWQPEVDLRKAGPWARRFRLHANELYELRVTVFDVNRKDWFEGFGKAIGKMMSMATGGIPGIGGLLKPLADDAASSIGRRITGDDDRVDVLEVYSADFRKNKTGGGTWSIAHAGYLLTFKASPV